MSEAYSDFDSRKPMAMEREIDQLVYKLGVYPADLSAQRVESSTFFLAEGGSLTQEEIAIVEEERMNTMTTAPISAMATSTMKLRTLGGNNYSLHINGLHIVCKLSMLYHQ